MAGAARASSARDLRRSRPTTPASAADPDYAGPRSAPLRAARQIDDFDLPTCFAASSRLSIAIAGCRARRRALRAPPLPADTPQS